jgi:pyrimidine and pyridine-specific 5'-nucleotidase
LLILSKALVKANIPDPSKCLFVDDDPLNVDAAKKLGWEGCVHFCERGFEADKAGKLGDISEESGVVVIDDLERLRTVWHYIFTHPT